MERASQHTTLKRKHAPHQAGKGKVVEPSTFKRILALIRTATKSA